MCWVTIVRFIFRYSKDLPSSVHEAHLLERRWVAVVVQVILIAFLATLAGHH